MDTTKLGIEQKGIALINGQWRGFLGYYRHKVKISTYSVEKFQPYQLKNLLSCMHVGSTAIPIFMTSKNS